MLIYNDQAFRELRQLLYQSDRIKADTDEELRAYMATLDSRLSISEPTFYNWFLNQKIPFCRLILLCNKTRFPIAFFFKSNPPGDVNTTERHYRLVSASEWVPVRTRFDYMISDMRIRCKLKRREIGERFGIKSTYRSFEHNDLVGLESVTLESLIACFQHPDLSPGTYLIDRNEPMPDAGDNHIMQAEESVLTGNISSLRAEVVTLRESLDEVTEELNECQHTLREKDRIIQQLTESQQSNSQAMLNLSKSEAALREENASLKRKLLEQHRYRKRNNQSQ